MDVDGLCEVPRANEGDVSDGKYMSMRGNGR